MATPENPFKRANKEQRRYHLKTLPSVHDTSLIQSERLNSEVGVGRVMRSFQQVEQANFDHLAEELRRFGNLFNEKEADTEYLRYEYEDHEQVSVGTPSATVQEGFWTETWHDQVNIVGEGGDVPASDVIEVQPYWCGENMHVNRLEVGLGDDTSLSSGEQPIDPTIRMYMAIYNGDGPGGAPGSLLVDGGQVLDDLTIPNTRVGVDLNVDLLKGHWYWPAFFHWPPSRAPYAQFRTDPNLNATPALEGLPAWGSWSNGPLTFGLDSESFTRDITVVRWEYVMQATGDDPGSVPGAGFPVNLPFNEYVFTTPTTWTGPYYGSITGTVMFLRAV